MLRPMAKKRKAPKTQQSAAGAPNNPFGTLSGLRDALPSAPETKTAAGPDPASTGVSPASVEPAAKGGKIVVRREKKGRSGKTITRISGLAESELALAKKMKKALGCGATVEGEDIVLLGSLVERAATWLEARGAKRVVRSD